MEEKLVNVVDFDGRILESTILVLGPGEHVLQDQAGFLDFALNKKEKKICIKKKFESLNFRDLKLLPILFISTTRF